MSIPFKVKVVDEVNGLPIVETTYWYAGRWRTAAGVVAHRAGRRRRHQNPIDRVKSNIASNCAYRERMIDGPRPTREV